MFSTHERLKRKTPEQGIGRREFIEHLVEEFHTTTNIEAQEQVTANLANFAYDPINWQFLYEAEAVDLFLQLLSVSNECLQLHGLAGLCNICLDRKAAYLIAEVSNFENLSKLFLNTNNREIVLNCVTLFHQILDKYKSDKLKQLIASPDILKRIAFWKNQTSDLRIVNICTIFLEDFGTRTETVNVSNPVDPSK